VSETIRDTLSLEQLRSLATTGAFEESLAGLESVVARLEQGHLSMNDALAWYEAGLSLARHCADLLEQAELRISTLESTYDLPGKSSAGGKNDAH
jgi:exodeoxyribonuclease VII small subunit